MEFKKENGTFKSTDGIHSIHYSVFIPEEVKAVVVIVHGMCEFKERYNLFSEFLAQNGIASLSYDQLGHGQTILDDSEKGWFGEKDGVEYIQGDVLKALSFMKTKFPGKKTVLFGHSMGSFIVRYFTAYNPKEIDALIVSGTSGGNNAIDIAIAFSSIISRLNGSKYVHKLLNTLTIGSNNKKFEKMGETSSSAWISRDKDVQKQCDKNMFIFTAQGFCDMFRMLKFVSSSEWYKLYPKKLPTFLVSGQDDPIGDFGKGVISVYMKLKIKKAENVEVKLFKDCRHEPINELNKDEVFNDILKWINNTIS